MADRDAGSSSDKDMQATQLEAGNAVFEKGVVEHAEKVVHADGTVDYLDAKALGGDVEQMPKGYFLSAQFIGTVTVDTTAQFLLRARADSNAV